MRITVKQKIKDALKNNPSLFRNRLCWLDGKDKALLKIYLDSGISFRQLAYLASVHEATISRRIHNIAYRLCDDYFPAVLANADEFSIQQIQIAQDYFVKGLPQRHISKKHNCSEYLVRQTIEKVRKLKR